ncbi:MAG: HEPN domain-containing protein [Nanoarchaeota archaeon]
MNGYEEWIEQAQDINTALYNLEGDKLEAAGFFFQQAAEKALKAFHIKKYKKLLKTHVLTIIAESLDAPKEVLEASKNLTPAYLYTRYPDFIKQEDLSEIINELKINAEEILK